MVIIIFLLTGPGYSMKQKKNFFFISWISSQNIKKILKTKKIQLNFIHWLSQVTIFPSTNVLVGE